MEEDARLVRAARMKKRGSWFNLEVNSRVKFGWNDIRKMECRLQFKEISV